MSVKLAGSIFFKCVCVSGGEAGSLESEVVTGMRTIKIQATVCRSIMRIQPSEITLPACLPGHKYYRDFSIINASDIALQYSVVMSPPMQTAVRDGSLVLSEVDNDEDAVTHDLAVLDGST